MSGLCDEKEFLFKLDYSPNSVSYITKDLYNGTTKEAKINLRVGLVSIDFEAKVKDNHEKNVLVLGIEEIKLMFNELLIHSLF